MITIRVNLGGVNFASGLAALGGESRRRINLSLANRLRRIVVTMFDSSGVDQRPIQWAPKSDGTPSNLIKTTTLVNSFGVEATSEEGAVFTPVVYASRHQFGGEYDVPEHDRTIRQAFGRPIDPPKTIRVRSYRMTVPARPFFPFSSAGELTPGAEAILVEAAEAGIERELSMGVQP